MSHDALQDALDSLDIAGYLDRQAIVYRTTHGARGPQLNVQTCPACGGAKWKVYLNAETGLGNCFSGSCEKKFTKYRFIEAHTGLSGAKLVEHIRQVASEQGWRAPRLHSVAVHHDPKSLRLPHSMPIPVNGRNLAYLENRGIGKEIARYFNLRFCLRGLFAYEAEGKRCYQSYDQRVLIPVYDLDGELVSFQGRDITGTADKKYLFPPGFAATGAHLYNAHNAVGTKRVVVGEGAFDVAALKIAMDGEPALRDVVPIGTFGKHLSNNPAADDQLAKFLRLRNERGIEEVTFMWDGERQAIRDACEAGLALRSLGFRVRIGVLPRDKDPNEVAPDAVRRTFYRAELLSTASAARISLLAA